MVEMMGRLTEAIQAVCPVYGASLMDGVVAVQYRPEATPEQRAAADAAVAAFDWSDAAHDAWMEDQRPHRKAIRQAAAEAISNNDAFLANGSPSNAQVLAQVRRLTQQMNHVIRRLIQID